MNKNSEYIIKNVFEKCLKGISSTILGFNGCGKSAMILNTLEQYENMSGNLSKHIFSVLDIDHLAQDENLATNEFLEFLMLHNEGVMDPNDAGSSKLGMPRILELIGLLTNIKDMSVTLLLRHFSNTYNGNVFGQQAINKLATIYRINPNKLSFIFLCDSEFGDATAKNLGILSGLMSQNFIWGNDLPFDIQEAQDMSKKQSGGNSDDTNKLIEKIYNLTQNDPVVFKIILKKTQADEEFLKDLLGDRKSVDDIYDTVGQRTLNTRYGNITDRLSSESLEFLKSFEGQPTEFIIKTGLVNKTEHGYEPMNELFSYFLEHLLDSEVMDKQQISLKSLGKILTGQEFLLMQRLVENPETLLSREKIAEAIWGTSWESLYSDEGIDQVVSKLRKKLKQAKYNGEVKSIKKKGIMLVQP